MSAYFERGDVIFSFTNKVSYVGIILLDVPMIATSALIFAFKTQTIDAVFFASLENMVLGVASIIFVIVDSVKDKTYFEKMQAELPFGVSVGEIAEI